MFGRWIICKALLVLLIMGKLVVITGIDGCGKSTQCKKLEQYLAEKNYTVCTVSLSVSRLSTYTDFLQVKGNVNKCKQKFKYYDKALILGFETYIKIKHEVQKKLQLYDYVILDRYWESNVFYTKVITKRYKLLKSFFLNLPQPDYYIYLKVSPIVAYSRILKRNETIKKHENIKTLKKIAKEFSRNLNNPKYCILNGEKSPESVLNSIKENLGV